MKSSSNLSLLSGPLSVCLLLFVVLITSCGGSNQTPPVSPALAGTFPLALTKVKDTSGNQPILHTSVAIPSGSQVVLVCVNNCNDTSGSPGSTKILFTGTLNQTIPENTELVLKIVSNDIK